MDESAQSVGADHPEQPQNQKYYRNGPEHRSSLSCMR
jgi:hypothetical protein